MKKEIFGTREWADKNYNVIFGCAHDCIYCYAKNNMIRFKKTTAEDGKMKKSVPKSLALGKLSA